MRSDPCIINIGEIRDEPTADAAIEASMTGNQVFSTTHTATASLIFARLERFKIPMADIAANLKAACAQRLIRKLCIKCSTPRSFTDEIIEMNGLPQSWSGKLIKQRDEKGCSECDHGYKDRQALFEILPISDAMAFDIEEKRLLPLGVQARAKKEFNVPTLRELALDAIESGLSDLDAVKDMVALRA